MLKLVDLAVGSVSALGVDLHQLTLVDDVNALIDELHRPGLAVCLDRTEEFHTEAEKSTAECVLAGNGIKLSRKDDEASENVVEHIEMVGYDELTALMELGSLLILPKSLALEEKQL